jgi:hypothetical protein
MGNNWIAGRIRERGRMALLWGLVFLAGAAGIAWKSREAIALGLAQPHPVSADDLASPETVDRLAGRPVTVESDEVVDTGVMEGYANRRDRVLARYLVVRVGDHHLLVKASASHQGNRFAGLLTGISSAELEKAVTPFIHEHSLREGSFLPAQLNCTVDTSRGLVVGGFFIALFLAPGIFWTGLGMWRLLRPQSHPLARALQRFGRPAEVADAIGQSGQPVRVGPVEIAGDWLVCRSRQSGVVVFRNDDLVWIHKLLETVNRRSLHRVKIYDRNGMRFVGAGSADEIDAVVAAITERLPWLVVGWDERVDKQWKEDPASLVPRVAERREELLARRQAGTGAPATGG